MNKDDKNLKMIYENMNDSVSQSDDIPSNYKDETYKIGDMVKILAGDHKFIGQHAKVVGSKPSNRTVTLKISLSDRDIPIVTSWDMIRHLKHDDISPIRSGFRKMPGQKQVNVPGSSFNS